MEVIADYNKDFYAWLMKNADLLRQHKFNEVDIEHDETGIDKNELPETCPFTFEQLLKKDFLPDDENHK